MPPFEGGIFLKFFLLVAVLTLLISNAAACLASRLAGGLALAATAVLCALAHVTGFKSLDSFHGYLSNQLTLIQD